MNPPKTRGRPGMTSATRREFLKRVGDAGGFAAVFSTMHTLGLVSAPEAHAEEIKLPPHSGKGVKVVILGCGIAGLVSAYELGKAGYSCTVLEARGRPGGRNWTVRGGTKIEFIDGNVQTSEWGVENYLNAGPARLPSIHKTILGYCRELGVPLEVEVNTSRSTLLVTDKAFDGKPIEQRQAINDTRGHVSELLAKCINQHALDQDLSKEDHDRMLEFLRIYGDLKPDYSFQGSARSGAVHIGGAGPVVQELRPPLDMHALLDANFWRNVMFEEMLDMQATMFQPVGGMDRIPHAFAKKLGSVVKYKSPVAEIRKTSAGVRVVYMHGTAKKQIEADYCICALPISILQSIPNDFSPRIQAAIKNTTYMGAYKIGWESKRFWERDFNIYGGISYVMNAPVGVVWYPSARMMSENGVLVAGYSIEGFGPFSELTTVDAKLDASRAAVEKLHPGYGSKLTKPIYVNWGKIPYNLGAWVGPPHPGPNAFMDNSYYEGPYKEFCRPDDRIYFAGDHCSHLGAWQEGAALAALRTVNMIGDRVRTA